LKLTAWSAPVYAQDMDERSSKKKEHDFAIIAFRVVQEATGEDEESKDEPGQPASQEPPGKNPNAVALGRLGGKKGGKARAANSRQSNGVT